LSGDLLGLSLLLGNTVRGGGFVVLLRLENSDHIGLGCLGSGLSGKIPGKHNRYLHSENSLSEEDVTEGSVYVVGGGVTGLDHVTVLELHGLGSLGSQLSGNDDLASLGSGLHNETEDTVASSSDGERFQELVSQGLSLGNGAETTVSDTLGVELDGSLGETESLLDDSGQLSDTSGLLSQDVSGASGSDDDFGSAGGNTDLNSRVTLLGQLTLQELVQLSVENAIGNELSLLVNLTGGGHFVISSNTWMLLSLLVRTAASRTGPGT